MSFSSSTRTKKEKMQPVETDDRKASCWDWCKKSGVKFIYVVNKCWPGTFQRLATCVQVNVSFACRRMRLQVQPQTKSLTCWFQYQRLVWKALYNLFWKFLGNADKPTVSTGEQECDLMISRTNKSVIGLLTARTRVWSVLENNAFGREQECGIG